MPKVNCLEDYFSKLEEPPISEIQKWLPEPGDLTILENKVGNRMLYPHIMPETLKDIAFNYAIIRIVIEKNPELFYNKNLRRIDIPEEFLLCFPDLKKLVAIYVDTIKPVGITTFSMKSSTLGKKDLGTLIRPENLETGGTITIGIGRHQYQIKTGKLVVIPVTQTKTDITFTSGTATLLGKKILAIEIASGQIGLIIDARMT